jgi:phosphoribosyl 1,2-cyclic phosphodiesterase
VNSIQVHFDAGTGAGDLSLAELAMIDHVFITHSHLDHVACLPFMVDTVGDMRNKPLTVHATQATLEIIQALKPGPISRRFPIATSLSCAMPKSNLARW